jgi:hypothetical protein
MFNTSNEIANSSMQKSLNLLAENDIYLDDDIPKNTHNTPKVELTYQVHSHDMLINKFLNGSYDYSNGVYEDREGNKLKIIFDKDISFIKSSDIVKDESSYKDELTKEELRILAMDYISEIGFESTDMLYWKTEKREDLYTVKFKQSFSEFFLDKTYMNVVISKGEVIKFERLWFNPPRMYTKNIDIIPPAKALYLFNDMEKDGDELIPVRIVKLELGYKLDSSSLVTSVRSGEASPYWRILTDVGNEYYIEAVE